MPYIGIPTVRSHFFLKSSLTPLPSLPTIIPIPPVRSALKYSLPLISAQAIQILAFLSSSTVLARLVTLATGTNSTAPAEVLLTIAERPTARLLGIITPCAPQASAVLIIAPKLCGSVISSQIMMNGSSPFFLAISRISDTSQYS